MAARTPRGPKERHAGTDHADRPVTAPAPRTAPDGTVASLAVPVGALREILAGFDHYEKHSPRTLGCACDAIPGAVCALHQAREDLDAIIAAADADAARRAGHTVAVQIQGMFGGQPVYQWTCSCGERGTMHPSETGCHAEAGAHAAGADR
jgi:hypothetical protein